MGIGGKCFEILENKPSSDGHSGYEPSSEFDQGPGASGYAPLGADGDISDEDEEDVGDDGMVGDEEEMPQGDLDDDDDLDAMDQVGWDEDDSDGDEEFTDGRAKSVGLKLREILFYDDKVAIFKARHGRL